MIEFLRTHTLLLVVDNCEHVLPAAARLVDQIVRHCPHVVVLATSREALGVEGERILPVPPLPVEDATTLFAERAKAGRPDFDLDHEPVGAVAEICRRLDGLPLAIELAAARMRAMSSLDVARRLDRLRLLSGGARDASPRQQSLVATIDWSYRLLTDAEQALFMRLSVFAGGFDLEAAHGVCGADGDTEDDTLDLLTGLLDKSMVKMRAGTDRSRYFVLETLRAYGRDRLRENGIADECASRHATYYTELAERAAIGMHGPDEGAWVERMLPDYDNLRVAFEHVIADRDMDTALRLVTSLSELVASANRLRVVWLGGAGGRAGGARPPAVRRRRRVRRPRRMEQGRVRPGALVGEPRGRACAGSRQRPRRLPGRRTGGLGFVRGRCGRGTGALRRGNGARPRRRRPDPAGVDAVLRGDMSCRTARSRERCRRRGGGGRGFGHDGEPDGAVDGALCAWPGAEEVRTGPSAGVVRRCGRAGRVGAELLVAWHRIDGGRGHPRRSRRTRNGRQGISST